MENKETAEQKLLKMIEASSDAATAPAKTQEKVVQKQSVLSVIKKINLFLIVGAVGAAVLLAKEVMAGTDYLTKGIHFNVDQNVINSTRKNDIVMPAAPRLSSYLVGITRRNFFQPFEQEEGKTAVGAPGKNAQITQKAAHLRLVGVSWLDTIDSASVMVEDSEKNMTYFLKKGERIGDIFVKTIYADSAVLGYDNEEMTIKYDKSQM